MKQFDEKFNEHVKNQFEGYETAYNPKAWKSVEAKLKPNRKRKMIIWFRYGIAASFFIVAASFGMNALLKDNNLSSNKIDENNVEITSSYRADINRGEAILTEKQFLLDSNLENQYPQNIKRINNQRIENRNGLNQYIARKPSQNFNSGGSNNKNGNGLLVDNFSIDKTGETAIIIPPDKVEGKYIALIVTSDPEIKLNLLVAEDTQAKDSNEKLKSIYSAGFDTNTNILNINKNEDALIAQNNSNQFKLGMSVGPSLNSSEGSNATAGINAGVLSEIPLSKKKIGILKNFKLYTGVLLASQNVNFDETAVYSSGRSFSFVEANSLETAEKPINSLNDRSDLTENSEISASLIGLDIPINIRFNVFNKKKTSTYVVAGLSSVFYLDESYNYTRVERYSSFDDADFAVAVYQANSNESAKTFDFARQLNFAFGVERKISKRTYLLIEPFYKHPLGGLTSEDLKFGSGGISLRVNFDVK